MRIKRETHDRCLVNALRQKAHFRVLSGLYRYLHTGKLDPGLYFIMLDYCEEKTEVLMLLV
jgi:hypothetical protein